MGFIIKHFELPPNKPISPKFCSCDQKVTFYFLEYIEFNF